MSERWAIRRAQPQDADAIASVARAAWRDTYHGLLRDETIETFVAMAYSADRLRARITSHHFLVAEGEAGIVAFADAGRAARPH